jgi:DNA topoisomerase-2
MEKMNELMQAREYISLKKTEKKRGYKKIEGLDNANKAGGKESKDCTLILCEGLSAKTYAVRGISKGWDGRKGRDYFGIFPLRGKLMNARNASTTSISSNKEVTSVIQALNLKYKTDYTKDENFDTLAYGKIMIIADADVDGLHIASLIINLFHVLFPSLFKRENPFFFWMQTPIAKVFPSGSDAITFYNDFDYQKELEKLTGKKFTCRYYKGLGSSNDSEVRDTFAEKVVSFQLDEDADKTLHMVFSKNTADDRKRWMEKYDANTYENPENNYPITKFVNQF